MVLSGHVPAGNPSSYNFKVTLGAPAVAPNQTQLPHLRQDMSMSVLGHEDGSTPHLTVAGVIIHVLSTRHGAGRAFTSWKHIHLCPDMSVLGHAITPHLTVAGVIIHVLSTSHGAGRAFTS